MHSSWACLPSAAGKAPWRTTAPPSKHSTTPPVRRKLVPNDNWKTDEPLDQWFGVRTKGDLRVAGLKLFVNQLSGTIPGEIGNLTHLTELGLGGNQLSGIIPGEIGNLTNLTNLGARQITTFIRDRYRDVFGRIP